MIQLHGEEDITYTHALSSLTGLPCIKVVHVPHDSSQQGQEEEEEEE